MIRRFSPRDAVETQLVQRLIDVSWKINRLRGAEAYVFNQQAEKEQKAVEAKRSMEVGNCHYHIRSAESDRETGRFTAQSIQERLSKAAADLKLAQEAERQPIPPPDAGLLLFKLLESGDAVLERVHKYQQRLDCAFNRTLRQLREMQAEEIEEVDEIAESDESANVQNEPNSDGTNANCKKEEELATDGARMNTDGGEDQSAGMHSEPSENARGAAVGPPKAA